jgi:hypothetical protein
MKGEFVAIISGYHVDEYCVQPFRDAVRMLQERFGAQKVTDFASIAPGDLIARVPPKITGDQKSAALRQIPVYKIDAVGDDVDEDGHLICTGQSDYLYFQSDCCYLLDLNLAEPVFEVSSEHQAGAIDYLDARDIGRLKEEHAALDEDLKGIVYRIPPEGATGASREAR